MDLSKLLSTKPNEGPATIGFYGSRPGRSRPYDCSSCPKTEASSSRRSANTTRTRSTLQEPEVGTLAARLASAALLRSSRVTPWCSPWSVIPHGAPSQAGPGGACRSTTSLVRWSTISTSHPVNSAVSFAVSRACKRVSRITNGERRDALITKISNTLAVPRR